MDYCTHTHCCTAKTSFDILPHQAGICDRRVHSGMGLQSEIKTIWAGFVSVCGAFSARLSSFIRGETAMIFFPSVSQVYASDLIIFFMFQSLDLRRHQINKVYKVFRSV